MVSAPVTETADSSDSWTYRNASSLSDTPCNAAQEAFNEIEKAHAIFLNEFKRHSHQNNVAEMVQMLDMTAETVPFDSHDLLKAHCSHPGARHKAKQRIHATVYPAGTYKAKLVGNLPQALCVGAPRTSQDTRPVV